MATRSWNRVELIGNLTRDPELRYTPQGTAVSTFSIATNRTYMSEGERKEEADFHRCVAWNKLAELCSQLLKKGNRVFVSGRLQNRSWEDNQGQTRQVTEIVIEDMLVLTAKSGSPQQETDHVIPEAPPKQEEVVASPSDVQPSDMQPQPEADAGVSEDQPQKTKEEVSDDLPF